MQYYLCRGICITGPKSGTIDLAAIAGVSRGPGAVFISPQQPDLYHVCKMIEIVAYYIPYEKRMLCQAYASV